MNGRGTRSLLGLGLAVVAGLLAVLGSHRSAIADDAGEVVVYAALDRQFSEPLLEAFTKETGIRVRAVYDAESTKTIGLVNRIRAERDRPRCDVFWNNEIVNTIRLMDEGLLQPCKPTAAADYPPHFRDPNGHWFGFAARARVLIVNTRLVSETQMPTSIRDLGAPMWRGKVGIAKPLFGTTATHVACLFAQLGEKDAAALLDAWKANEVVVTSGNKTAAESVGAGRLAFALTDTDDAVAEVDAGKPVKIVFPDQSNANATEGGAIRGALLLPNTVMLIRGAPNASNGEKLINYLLSPAVESTLAQGRSAQIPLNPKTNAASRIAGIGDVQPMVVDWAAAARAFDAAAKYVESKFLE